MNDKLQKGMLRGGSYFNNRINCRVRNRNNNDPDNRNNNYGFRLVFSSAHTEKVWTAYQFILLATTVNQNPKEVA